MKKTSKKKNLPLERVSCPSCRRMLAPACAKCLKCGHGSWGRDMKAGGKDHYYDYLYFTTLNVLQLEVYYRYKRNKR